MPRAGPMREFVEFQMPTRTDGNWGESIRDWTTYLTSHAQIRCISRGEALSGAQAVEVNGYNLICRFDSRPRTNHRILWHCRDGTQKILGITACEDLDVRGKLLSIDALHQPAPTSN